MSANQFLSSNHLCVRCPLLRALRQPRPPLPAPSRPRPQQLLPPPAPPSTCLPHRWLRRYRPSAWDPWGSLPMCLLTWRAQRYAPPALLRHRQRSSSAAMHRQPAWEAPAWEPASPPSSLASCGEAGPSRQPPAAAPRAQAGRLLPAAVRVCAPPWTPWTLAAQVGGWVGSWVSWHMARASLL